MKGRWQVLDTKPFPCFLTNCLILQDSYSNIDGALQMMGAETQIKDLDLLLRYSFYPLLNPLWSSSQRDFIGHHNE